MYALYTADQFLVESYRARLSFLLPEQSPLDIDADYFDLLAIAIEILHPLPILPHFATLLHIPLLLQYGEHHWLRVKGCPVSCKSKSYDGYDNTRPYLALAPIAFLR